MANHRSSRLYRPSFFSHDEIKAVRPVTVQLSWTFLIQFDGKDTPEKQTIKVAFVTSEGWRPYRQLVNRASFLYLSDINESQSYITARIYHTARSWGNDLEGLLSNTMKSFIRPENKFKALLLKYSWVIAGLTFLVLILAGTAGIYSKTHQTQKAIKLRADALKKLGSSGDVLQKKLDFVIDSLTTQPWDLTRGDAVSILAVLITLSLLVTIMTLFFVEEYAKPERSFLLLTTKARQAKEEEDSSDRTRLMKLIASQVFAASMAAFKYWVLPILLTLG